MATYISNGSGDWTTIPWLTAATGTLAPTAPAGAPPQSGGGDKIIIRGPHVVTYNVVGEFGDQTSTYTASNATTTYAQTLTSNAIALSGNCTFRASRLVTTALSARGTIFIGQNATFDWGTLSDPLTGVNSTVTLHYQPGTMTQGGAAGIYLYGTGTTASISNNIYINGEEKTTHTFLTQNHASGATTLFVDSVSGWKVGDRLVVATENPSLILNTTAGILSSAIIQNIDTVAKSVTISPGLNNARSAGTRVGNFTSNVTFRSFNPEFPSYGMFLFPSFNANILINNFKAENLGWSSGWIPYTGGTALRTDNTAGIYYIPQYQNTTLNPIKGICFDMTNPTNRSSTAFRSNFPSYASINMENCVHYSPSYTSTSTSGFFILEYLSQYNITNCCTLHSRNPASFATTFPANVVVSNSFFDCSNAFSASINGLNVSVRNCRIRSNNTLSTLDGTQKFDYNTCFIHLTAATAPTLISPLINAIGNLSLTNCTLSGNALIQPTTTTTAQKASIRINQLNNNQFDYRRYNSYYTAVLDLTARKNGTTSYRIKPNIANTTFNVYEYIPAAAGVSQRIKCNLRFDSAYGTANPPSISFIGAGVNQTFTCPAVANTWHEVDLTLNPTSTDDIEVTVAGQSSNINGFVWLDGIPFNPFITDVRWYGFQADKALDRTLDTLTTLTENQVSSVDITNLDRLYDASNYWTINNPLSTSYLDLHIRNGNVLDFGNRNIVVNNSASTNFTYASASNTITIKAPMLSAGNNFNTLKTTGNITLANGDISFITINGNVFEDTPVSLSGVNINGLLTYNTNVSAAITYTNTIINKVVNNGSANVLIKRVNSTISDAIDPEIQNYAPTIINITPNGGSVAIFDNTGTKRYFITSNTSIELPPSATGTWFYKAVKYGFLPIQQNFEVNQSTGNIYNISPIYTANVANVDTLSNVVAYTNLNTTQKMYDYLSYYETTNSGIDYTLVSKAAGSITFAYSLTLDATASTLVNFTSNVITLKSTGIDEDIILAVNGTYTELNGALTTLIVKLRSNNLDSELGVYNVNSVTLFPSISDREANTNPGPTFTTGVYRFKYGNTTLGVVLSGTIYARVDVNTILLYQSPIVQGNNILDLGVQGQLSIISRNQSIINTGVQKSSILVPHKINL